MIELLIATVNCDNIRNLVTKMNIETNCVVSNQNGIVDYDEYIIKGNSIKCYSLNSLGVGINRNNALFNSTAEICVLADDDIEYYNDYSQIIEDSFRAYQDVDLIIFNLDDKENKRYKIKKVMNINKLNYTKFGAARISFRRQSILKKRVSFSTLFGGGAMFSAGEDTLFLKDCLDSGLKVKALPITIGKLDENSKSTWFNGYNEKLIRDSGACYSLLFKYTFYLRVLHYAIKRKKEYAQYGISFRKCVKLMYEGAKELKDM